MQRYCLSSGTRRDDINMVARRATDAAEISGLTDLGLAPHADKPRLQGPSARPLARAGTGELPLLSYRPRAGTRAVIAHRHETPCDWPPSSRSSFSLETWPCRRLRDRAQRDA